MGRRRSAIVLVVLAVAIVGFFVIKAFVPGFGIIEGRHDVVAIGKPITVLVDRPHQETATIEVTELAHVTDAQRERWQLNSPLEDIAESDLYLVRFTVSATESPLAMVPRQWRLLDEAGALYPAGFIHAPDEADCERFDDIGDGCVVVAVPEGTDVTMVRFYGVALGRKTLVGENWAGWSVG